MTTQADNLLYLFDRPTEPLIVGKGNDPAKLVLFNIPSEYLVDRFKLSASKIQNRFSGGKNTVIPVTKLSTIPDLSFPLQLSRDASFSLFNPYHCKMASKLIEIAMAMKNVDELMSLAVYCRDRINPYMFIYVLSVVVTHRPETRKVRLPSHVEMFPSLYMKSSVFSRVREESEMNEPGSRTPIEISANYTATNLDHEHRVSYFREDIGINLHHWHWHLVYPYDGPLDIVNKDRRGELFYYMHQQIIARYNMERLSNNMNRVVRLTNWRDPIEEAYFPKLDDSVASRVWPSRTPNMKLSNLNRQNPSDRIQLDIDEMERWRDRIFNAIHSGFIVDPAGKLVKLSEKEGIDVLGNLIESSILSPNPNFYGSLHNNGHNAIGYIHDPDYRYLENVGVMGKTSTALRDPVFYRWHACIDDIFQEYKETLPAYNTEMLGFDNVRVVSVEVSATGIPLNEFATFWQQSDIDLSRGLDFMSRGPVYVRVTHLQYEPFNYKFVVENNGNQRVGTVRIFIAPKYDEQGGEYLFRDQRKLFVELDRYTVSLKTGKNEFTRSSLDSSVTIPHEVTYRNLDNNEVSDSAAFNFCGCGWPQNMLIAKGSAEGFQCQLFVMVSNGADDQVENSQPSCCENASSYCGVLNERYPDARSMGYPFDRLPRARVNNLQEFLTPNMITQDVCIRFSNRTVAPGQNNKPGNQGNVNKNN